MAGAQARTAPGKLALIVAIGNYPQPNVNGYRPINSLNDIPLVETALKAQGFEDQHIRILRDAEADRAGMLSAMDDLFERARAGDVVVFHYSGHGDQLTDNDGDEVDGFDEVLVPYGAPANAFFLQQYRQNAAVEAARYASDAAGFKHVRDDELNRYFARLRERVGPAGNVVVLIDSCHSGTGTRGASGPMPRGPGTPIGRPAAAAASGSDERVGIFEEAAASSGAAAPFVVISASRQQELNYETRREDGTPVGPLSLALSRVLPVIRPGDSYRALFDRIAVSMSSLAPNQVPQMEGDTDTEVFSGRAMPYEPYYRVRQVRGTDGAVLAGGRITGLVAESRIAFYPIGAGPTGSSREPLARGRVTRADDIEALVTLDAPVPSTIDLRESWAYVTEYAFGALRVRVHLASDLDDASRMQLEAQLANQPMVEVTRDAAAADLVVEIEGTSRAASPDLRVKTAVDRVALGDPVRAGVSQASQLRERVLNFARNRYLKQVTMTSPDVNVQLEVVPATHRYQETVRGRVCVGSDIASGRASGRSADAGRASQLREGDGFLLRLRNTGRRPAHVAVLELYPDGAIGQLFPGSGLSADEARLSPGQEILVDALCFEASPPYGNYTFKLFATDATDRTSVPLDFSPILTTGGIRGTRDSRPLSPFEQLLASTYEGTRSGVAPRVAAGVGSTDAVLMTVVPR